MADYIERDAAIKRFNFAVLDCLGMEPTIRAGDIIKALESIPAADVREAKRGKWNRTNAYPHRLYCSVCYKTYLKNDELLERWEFPLNFCPNCGADMRSTNCTKTATADEEREVLNVRAWLNNGADMREES